MELGLSEQSTEQEKIVVQDESTAVKYTIQKETIDLDQLRKEKEALEAQLAEKEPSEEELVAMAKSTHPYYYRDLDKIKSKIAEIEAILNG